MTRPKEGELYHALYVNMTTHYESFKIEKVKYLGIVQNRGVPDTYHAVEDMNDGVNYLSPKDLHKTEKDAEIALMKMLASKWGYNLSK